MYAVVLSVVMLCSSALTSKSRYNSSWFVWNSYEACFSKRLLKNKWLSFKKMNIYYYLINLWPMLLLLVLFVVIGGIKKLLHKRHQKQH